MAVAADDRSIRPGMVAVVQTIGDQLNLHPDVHALVTRGGWTGDDTWRPVPCASTSAAEELFRHKVIRLLQREGLLDEERTRLLLSWRHSGFSVLDAVTVPEGDGRGYEPVELLRIDPAAGRCGVAFHGRRSYLQRFLRFDEQWDLRRASRPFTFRGGEIEFPAGACLSHSGADLLVTLGVEDREAWLCRIPLAKVLDLLRPLP